MKNIVKAKIDVIEYQIDTLNYDFSVAEKLGFESQMRTISSEKHQLIEFRDWLRFNLLKKLTEQTTN